MRADRRYTFLKKLRFGAITALLAVLMVFPAYGQYGGSSEKIRNDFSIRGTGYSIEYSLNGGAWKKRYSPPVKYERGETVILPEKSELIYGGYSFSGWFRSPDFSGEPAVQIGPDESGDILLYARWDCDHSQGTDMKYDGQTHWFYCRVCGKITEYGNHSFSSLLIKEPDCITNGIHRYSCRCGYEYDAPDVAALGHAWKNGLDYNETYHVRFCSRCRAEREKADHSLLWQENGSQCWQGCSGCGYTRNRYNISLMYNIGAMAASDWWSQSNQIKVESRSVSIRPGTMLLVSADYRVDSSPFRFNVDFYPDEAGCEIHLSGETYRQHINWWTGAMPGYATQFRLFDNLNTSCNPSNRAILENCRIYKVNTAAGVWMPAKKGLYRIPEGMTATPSQAGKKTPSQAGRKTPSQAAKKTPSQIKRKSPSHIHKQHGCGLGCK